MQEQQYQVNMGVGADVANAPGSSGSSGLARFLLGLVAGLGVATPVTALIVKKICDNKHREVLAKAVEEAENRGIQAGIAVAVEETAKQSGSDPGAISEQINGIPEGVSNEIPVYLEHERIDAIVIDTHGEVTERRYRPDGVIDTTEAYMASLQAPEEDSSVDYDLENYDLSIDDEEATESAAEFSKQHVQYLDMVERYRNAGGEIPPMTISREQFENEHYFEKCYVNWYEDDDVFEEEDSKIEDPGYSFGFNSGREMFAPGVAEGRDDPDVCYIRNMKLSTDFEITRMHASYEKSVVDGEAYYNGATNSQF